MRKLLTLLAVAALGAAPARAQVVMGTPAPPPWTGFYAGGSLGYVTAKNGCVGILSGGGRGCDNTDIGFGVFGGWQFSRHFAGEIGWKDFGQVIATGATTREAIATSVFEVAGLGFVPLMQGLSIYGKVGGYRAYQDASRRGIADETSNGSTYGGGLQSDFGRWGLRAQWQRFRKVGRSQSFFEVQTYDVLSVDAIYRF